MARLIISGSEIPAVTFYNSAEVSSFLKAKARLDDSEYYLERNGKKESYSFSTYDDGDTLHCILRVYGGKGGFGSMLRAIGAQIEKTTNREACRDLSGRRLRDINEEKRVKSWLEKQSEKDKSQCQSNKRKIDKLLSVSELKCKDVVLESGRNEYDAKVVDAIDIGLKKKPSTSKKTRDDSKNSVTARSNMKTNLWIGTNSDLDDSEYDTSDNEINTAKHLKASRNVYKDITQDSLGTRPAKRRKHTDGNE